MAEYIKSELIKSRRIELGITREELAEGICDVSTLLRYELGILEPTDEKFDAIQRKLDLKGNKCILPYNMSLFMDEENYIEYEQILQMKEIGDIQMQLEQWRKEIEMTSSIEGKQFIKRIEILEYISSPNIYLKELEKIILLSIPDYNEGDFSLNRVFNLTELHILNDISIAYWKCDKKNIALNIYIKLIDYFETAVFIRESRMVIKIMINYSNYLGQMGNHEKSIEVCREGIRWSMKNDCQPMIYNLLFNIGWNYHQISIQSGSEEQKEKARKYIQASYDIGVFFNESYEALDAIQTYLRNVF